MFRFIQRVFGGTDEPVVDAAQQFHDEYPLSLAGRLEYLEQRLQLQKSQILNMAGAPRSFADDPAVARQEWEELLAQQTPEHVEQLAAIEAAIVDYLADVNFDLTKAAEAFAAME